MTFIIKHPWTSSRDFWYIPATTSILNGNHAGPWEKEGGKRAFLCWTWHKEYKKYKGKKRRKTKQRPCIQQTKWLHILEQFLGPVIIITLSIAFQCAGAPIQMVLWRSIKNNFAHHQAQEGPKPANGMWVQMPAQATAPKKERKEKKTTTQPHGPYEEHLITMGTQWNNTTCQGGTQEHLCTCVLTYECTYICSWSVNKYIFRLETLLRNVFSNVLQWELLWDCFFVDKCKHFKLKKKVS